MVEQEILTTLISISNKLQVISIGLYAMIGGFLSVYFTRMWEHCDEGENS